jgi:hypothetical protein
LRNFWIKYFRLICNLILTNINCITLDTQNIFLLASNIFFINWTVRMSDNLPERVQILGHAHIICITVWENRIICCQIFCDLLLKSAFEQISNVMQLILVKIKWHIKRKYLIQKFRNICLSYYFKIYKCFLYQIGSWIVLYSNYFHKTWVICSFLKAKKSTCLSFKHGDHGDVGNRGTETNI